MPFYDKDKSRLKMVALMPHGMENQTRYSPIDQNNKPDEEIMRGMLRRFTEKYVLAKHVRVYQFYEKGVKIHEIKRPTQ